VAEQIETVVIGGGQAGLSASYHLTQRGREHVVLEQGAVANTWRTKRWDGFYLNTPNWTLQLPGGEYAGSEPDSFAPLVDIIAYLDAYARTIDTPVRTGVRVTKVRPRGGGGWFVDTDDATLEAQNVVVATGAFQRPFVPEVGDADGVAQLHAEQYLRPEQLPQGGVLVVGSGQTGCQITEELVGAGRDVYLSVGACPWFPRRHRGRDILHWLLAIGLMDDTVDKLPSPAAKLACNPALSGTEGGHDCNPLTLAGRGARLVGRLQRVDGTRRSFAPGLAETLARGSEFAARLLGRIDEHIRISGTEAPEHEQEREEPISVDEAEELDLRERGIGTILWSSGYRPEFGWIDVPVTDHMGWPVQQRGVSEHAGLYLVGLNWLHKRKSALLFGVGEDAEHVVTHLAAAH
jgi:putative flavoprotein involved in K+ transport